MLTKQSAKTKNIQHVTNSSTILSTSDKKQNIDNKTRNFFKDFLLEHKQLEKA
jgi:hypothetical protein